ncbi:MAG: hypothetical protein JXK51_10400 [Halothiobacillaceae bacterium]|nr:hypothetical protein [Halothiobacillaceae bacterium]
MTHWRYASTGKAANWAISQDPPMPRLRALDAGVMLAAKIQRFDAKAELWRRLEFVVHDPSAGRA